MMKTRLGALLIACAALVVGSSLAEAKGKAKTIKSKNYSVSGLFLAGPVSQQIEGANLATTNNSYTVTGGGIPATVNGEFSENDFGTVAIANGTVNVNFVAVASGFTGTFTAIQIGPQIYAFGTGSGTVEGTPIFGFTYLTGSEAAPPTSSSKKKK